MAVWGILLIGVLFGFGLLGLASTGQDGAVAAISFTWMPLAGIVIGGQKIFDWKGIEKYKTLEEKREKIIDAANHFVRKSMKAPLITAGKMTTGDPNLMPGQPPIALVTSDSIKVPDRGYEVIFDEVDMRASNNDTFEMLDVTGGVTFYQVSAGEEAKISKVPKSAKTLVPFLRFLGGINILDDWLRFNKFYLIDQLFSDTIRRWWNNKATIFYGLLAALSNSINEAFATDDVTTINNACSQILVDLHDAGYPVDENSQFVITCNPKTRGRIYKALAASFSLPNLNNSQIMYNISAVVSTTKIANTSYYVSLPGDKNMRGEWEDLNMRLPQRDEVKLGATHVWTGAYNGIIGEPKQHRRCSLA